MKNEQIPNEKKEKAGFFTFTSERIGANLPYVYFLMLLAILYIANAHYTEKQVRKIDRLKNEIRELTWEYMTVKSGAIRHSTFSNLSESVEGLHLSNAGNFPKKLDLD